MSLDGAELRNAVLQKTKSEISQCLSQRQGALRALFRITSTLSTLRPPQAEDWICSTIPTHDEQIYLEANDLEQGRRFNDTTLPFPTLDVQQPPLPSTLPFSSSKSASSKSPHVVGGPSLEEQLRTASASPSVVSQALPVPKSPQGNDNAHAATPGSTNSRPERPSHLATSAVEEKATDNRSTAAQPASLEKSTPLAVQPVQTRSDADSTGDVAPETVVPPTIEDEDATTFPNTSTVAPSPANKAKAPQVVHLPPQAVQEARLKETEQKLDAIANKERKEDEKLAAPSKDGLNDLVSSPSSTVGGYSQATPHAPHHSPDTSPDTESFRRQTGASIQTDDLLDPAAQQVKEDHERALQKQMIEARRKAREMHSPTPDIEQQLENEQAIRIARDVKDHSQDANVGQPVSLLNQVKEVVRDASSAREQLVLVKNTQDSAIDSLPTPTTIAPEPTTNDDESIEDTHHGTKATDSHSHPTPPADADVDMNDAIADGDAALTAQSNSQASPGPVKRKSATIQSPEIHDTRTALVPRSSNISASFSPPRPKSRQLKSGEVSTVVFAKKAPHRGSKAMQSHNEDYASLLGASEDTSRDYLEGLFKYQAHHPPRSAPLQELVSSARKTVTTAGTLAMIREHQDYKILKRVYQLQNANRWSLRQLQKSVEPERPFTHHDQLLLEMKWMRTDFREERSWKKALAGTFARWCADFINSSQEARIALRVKARIPETTKRESDDEDMTDAPTPDLVHSQAHETESESYAEDDELLTPMHANAPAGIFSLDFSDVVMKIERTPASDQMFRELPFYEPILEGSDGNPFSTSEPPILPVSKYVTGKLVSQIKGPPRKRSRYDYDSEDEPSTPPSRSGTSAEHSMPSTPGRRLFCRNDLPPEMTDVALFNAENKHVRDRLQAAHQFRPPTEFNMPSVAFFENRIPSQWLWEEDQKLRALVKEYTFNWSLVSQQLSLPSLFVSGSGRRTPWECFERWVQLEGLPAEMSKTQYFRTYQGRLEQANKTVFAQYQAQQQQQQQQQQSQAPAQPRRRPTTTPIRVERRRENRHLAIIDGMRKLARKRESAAHKQAESQKAAALRKAHEPVAPKNTVHTPQEFSRLKWEREEKLKMRQQQNEMAVRQQLAAQRQAQMQGQVMPNGANQMPRNGTPGGANGMTNQIQNTSSQQGQNAAAMAARAHQGMQANFANNNNNMPNMPMGTPGVAQAQMHGNAQNAQRMTPQDQMRAMAMQRSQFPNNSQQQQHQFQLQQQQINMASGMAQGMNMTNISNANMMASMSNQNLAGNMNAGMNGNMNGNMNLSINGMANNAGSPRMNPVNGNMQQTPARPLSSGHMPGILQLQNTIKQQHPEWSQEQCQKHASDQLQRYLAKQQRNLAMNAAAGSSGMSPSPQMSNNQFMQHNGGMANSPSGSNAVQNYQQQLVQQQRMIQQRQQANSPLAMNARPESRSATPQNPQTQQQSPGLQQAQVNRS